MRVQLTFPFLLLTVLAACSDAGNAVADASARYKAQRDYASLEVINGQLSKGMPREQVERLLGEPDYSPTEGQYYYSSNRREVPAGAPDRPPVTYGLIVDYRNTSGVVTRQLQHYTLGPIGE